MNHIINSTCKGVTFQFSLTHHKMRHKHYLATVSNLIQANRDLATSLSNSFSTYKVELHSASSFPVTEWQTYTCDLQSLCFSSKMTFLDYYFFLILYIFLLLFFFLYQTQGGYLFYDLLLTRMQHSLLPCTGM